MFPRLAAMLGLLGHTAAAGVCALICCIPLRATMAAAPTPDEPSSCCAIAEKQESCQKEAPAEHCPAPGQEKRCCLIDGPLAPLPATEPIVLVWSPIAHFPPVWRPLVWESPDVRHRLPAFEPPWPPGSDQRRASLCVWVI